MAQQVVEKMLESVMRLADTEKFKDDTFVQEMFNSIQYMIQREDYGWQIFKGGEDDGRDALSITLKNLKDWESSLAELTLGAAWMKRGLTLRHSYIWANGGPRYGNVPAGGTQGKQNIQKFIDRPDNQLHFFGKDARRRREARLYYSGIALYLGNDKTKQITAIPLSQITDQMLDPDGLGIIWAYKREWTERNIQTGEKTERKAWIFTHNAASNRVKYINEVSDGGATEKVEVLQDYRIFDQHANRIEGVAYGVPDALAAASWHTIAKNAFLDGVQMTSALASFAFQVTSKSGRGATKASIELASPTGAGSTAVVGQNDLQSISSAGKSYDFASLTSLLAIIATSLDVSVVHLSASPGDAGASYSAAEVMDLPTRLAMATRRDQHVDLDTQVLVWMGAPDPEVAFPAFESGAETYRSIQALILAAQSGAYDIDELRHMIDDLLVLPTRDAPPGALNFNNIKSEVARAQINTPSSDTADVGNTSVASPAQGRSNTSGGQSGAANDLRTDGVSD